MTARRTGMTLIELVAALALLALIVTASLPVLQGAAASLETSAPLIAVEDLGAIADRVTEDPAAFGLDPLEAIDRTEIAWPGDGAGEAIDTPITIELLYEAEADYAWLRFSSGDVATLRWFKLEDEP
jgi:prepilin-type N-terminal cleavage/methylation domain-containing protein